MRLVLAVLTVGFPWVLAMPSGVQATSVEMQRAMTRSISMEVRQGRMANATPVPRTGCKPGPGALHTLPEDLSVYSLTGCVTDRSGKAIDVFERVSVTPLILNLSMSYPQIGRYAYLTLYPGRYTVGVEADGYEPASKVVTITQRDFVRKFERGGPPVILDFVLERKGGKSRDTPALTPLPVEETPVTTPTVPAPMTKGAEEPPDLDNSGGTGQGPVLFVATGGTLILLLMLASYTVRRR